MLLPPISISLSFNVFSFSTVSDCGNISLVGDGFCNDETNNEICNYDGGDCCLYVNNIDQCSNCICYFEEFCATGFHPLVGDGICNDETNIAACKYDKGDCCLSNVVTDLCSECTCHLSETCITGLHPLVGNGFCNDVTNIAECNYDEGECCGPDISCELKMIKSKTNIIHIVETYSVDSP